MDKIKDLLDTINIPNDGLNLKKLDGFYWGKSLNGDIVYGMESDNKHLSPFCISTRYLKIYLNTEFVVTFKDLTKKENLSLIVLKKDGICFLDIFVRLTNTIASTPTDQGLLDYFLKLKDLFSNDTKKSVIELQGLYGELFTMMYLKEKYNFDISKYYQSEDKRKFDFSVSERKKIEVKTTTLQTRIHRFKLEQLNELRYDIIIVSIMFQKDDKGISLYQLIEQCKTIFSSNLKLLMHIENMIRNVDKEVLDTIKYNTCYLKDNLRLFRAIDVPRILEKTMDGIFNIEFDSDLSVSKEMSEDITEWALS